MRSLRRFGPLFVSSIALLSLAACTGSSTTDVANNDASDVPSDIVPPPPAMACRAGTTWNGTTRAFRSDGTAAWGLADARGTNLSVPDLDGDGYADLVVLDGTYNLRTDLDAMPPTIHVRVYMNRPRDGGGRTFVDATRSSNLLALNDGTGGYGRVVTHIAFADMDNDGDVDAVTGVYVNAGQGAPEDPGDRSVVMLNDGHGVFALATDSAITGSSADIPQLGGLTFTDQDRDGNIDVFMGYFYELGAVEVGQQHQLFHGAGDGTFTDVTDAVGLTMSDQMSSFATAGQRRPLYGVTACDLNDDGRQELLGAAYGRQWNPAFLNEGTRYSEVGRSANISGDANIDYHTDQSYLCYCVSHPTDIAYCPPGTPAPIYQCPLRGWRKDYNDQPWRLNGNTFSIACGDIDNDGDMDLYTAEIHHPDVGTASDVSEMLVNNSTAGGALNFTRPGRDSMGLTPGSTPDTDEGGLASALFDFDDDGRLDAFLGASDYPQQFGWVFHQNATGTGTTFTEVGTVAGFHHACPHGMAIADFDHDGDQDVIVGSSTARDCAMRWRNGNELRVYENTASEANWTSIRLVGRGAGGANRSAIGARVRVTAGGVTQTREINGVWGHFSGEGTELPAHFGLGANCTIDRVEVRWPDAAGTIQTFTNVVANYRIELREGDTAVRYTVE